VASLVAVSSLGPATASIGVAGRDRRARARIAAALGQRPELAVSAGASPVALVRSGAAADAIVVHCGEVSSEQLAQFAELRSHAPELRIVAVCESADGRGARRALDAGVDGLVFAADLDIALEPTVAAVLAGQTAVPRELRASVRKPALSFREKQILGMVVMGFTNAEISAQLYLAESTVKSHLSSAFTKLGVRSRSEAAAMILDPHGSLGTGILAISTDADPEPGVAGRI
jgi:DNA-binding NarL/FixJ family response regulator